MKSGNPFSVPQHKQHHLGEVLAVVTVWTHQSRPTHIALKCCWWFWHLAVAAWAGHISHTSTVCCVTYWVYCTLAQLGFKGRWVKLQLMNWHVFWMFTSAGIWCFVAGCAFIDILKGCAVFIFRVRKSDMTAYVWQCRHGCPSRQELHAAWLSVVSQKTWVSATQLLECQIWHHLNNLKTLLVVHNTRQYSNMKHTHCGLDFTITG